MFNIRFKTDMRPVERLEQTVPKKTRLAARDAAQTLADDIRSNWSATSPSSPGTAPAVDTGNLDSDGAIQVDEQGRDELGHFAGKDAVVFFVHISAASGDEYHGRGDYAPYLEYGTYKMEARPFVEPAVERIRATYEGFFTDIFR